MAENGNRKRRIARIGSMSSGKVSTKLHCEDGLMQDDCNLVYNIMQSMNKSQNVMSYQQLQEFRSREKSTQSNSDQNSSSKQNDKIFSSKQIKKFVSEKTFPLMAKCQKSMKYLKKNRCVPKPRAHVGFIPRPPQIPISSLQPNMCNNHTVSNNTVSHKACSMKNKQSSKKSRCSPEMNERLKKTKASHSVDNFCDINASQTESFGKESKCISDADTDSDNEFEQFLQKHHPEKCVRRKIEKNKKFKKKKFKQFICAKKIAEVTRKTLSESEESAESEVECNTLTENNSKNINIDEEEGGSSRRFKRIIEYENSDDSATDTHVNDSGTLNYDSFSSSEDENMVNKSLNKENDTDTGYSNRLDTLPAERSFVSSATSSFERQDTLCCDVLKLKCKIPCYVLIKRDPLLDRRAASLHAENSVVTNAVPILNSNHDEDDCIIIIETSTNNFTNQNSENITPSIESGNSNQGESIISKSPCVSEASTNINDVQNKYMLNEELIFSSNILKPLSETNSNEKSAEILFDESTSLEVQKNEKEVSKSVTASRKSLCDAEKDKCCTLSKATRHSHKNVISTECEDKSTSVANPLSRHTSDLPNNEANVSLRYNSATSATEKEMFNVQILSVKSLNESDIIDLSDDNEEKNMEPIPTMNETKESAAEDSDVEIICLDSSIVNKEKCVIKNVTGVLKNETRNKVNGGMKENLSKSSAQPLVSIEDDCVILDDLDLPSENACTSKNIGQVEQSSQVFDIIGNVNEGTNSNKNEKTSGNSLDSDRNSILKILGTIDFNCINKVLNETTATDTRKESIPAKAENSLCDNIEISERTPCSFPEKPKQGQNDACLPQKQVSIDACITPIGPFEVNIKKSSLNTTLVGTREKRPKLVKNSNVLHNINSGSENVPSSIKLNSTPSSSDDKSSIVCVNSNTALTVPKSFVSEKEIVASSHKTEPNALRHSRKNQQLLPVCTKVESCESPSDELDNLAAKTIQNLDAIEKKSIVPLLELYRAEYKRFMEIKSTEQNVSAGLKLLQEQQTKKLLAISSSIKNVVKKDRCFHKINNEFGSNRNEHKSFIKSDSVEKDGSLDEIKKPLEFVTLPSISSYPDVEKDNKVRIFNQCVVERASEVLNSDGSSSSQEVYNHLINSVCAECGKHAVAACSGCAKIYYCSEKCGMTYWNKGHFETCRR
ncbi:hypothetical protein AVEN_92165-1 [Araneus ventricosus]|uniref:MYND-type domain-containing protein n=1 Tax=Araneus ventricosus TaxID=182803 RepID=A0A4Y2G959_ARAVE|nr:hypothetical protein AVEN_92165-1 [Araneus ventricosus]